MLMPILLEKASQIELLCIDYWTFRIIIYLMFPTHSSSSSNVKYATLVYNMFFIWPHSLFFIAMLFSSVPYFSNPYVYNRKPMVAAPLLKLDSDGQYAPC